MLFCMLSFHSSHGTALTCLLAMYIVQAPHEIHEKTFTNNHSVHIQTYMRQFLGTTLHLKSK